MTAGEPARPALHLKLDAFEGPLDLLLHLIRSQQLDVRDIPIALVTEQYLAYLDMMQELDVDLAGEWLVVAATLVHIKSKLLLPAEPAEETGEEADPRDELVRRLLEYERFKEAGRALSLRELLGRDVFARLFEAPELSDPALVETGPRSFAPVSVSELLASFARALANRPRQTVHEILVERISLADKITELLDRLAARESLGFEELFRPGATRAEIVVSFLAVLELIRLKVVRVYQAGDFGPIRVFRAAEPVAAADVAAAIAAEYGESS
jgi:segregation and condensation protein A